MLHILLASAARSGCKTAQGVLGGSSCNGKGRQEVLCAHAAFRTTLAIIQGVGVRAVALVAEQAAHVQTWGRTRSPGPTSCQPA